MYPILLTLLLAAPPADPTSPGLALAPDAQWAAVAACVRVVIPGEGGAAAESVAAGVCVGYKDGLAYILTAESAVPPRGARAVEFFTRESYPKPVRAVVLDDRDVGAPFDAAGVALVRAVVGPDPVPVARVAGPGQRPKKFSFPAVSVGCPAGGAPVCRGVKVEGKKLFRRADVGPAFLWDTADPPAGAIGGPLLDGTGRVVGMCVGTGGGRAAFVHADELVAGLKRAGYGWLTDPPVEAK
ncbi:S1 family peptidase [Fimbriiglobus ruber]|uniref:Serine protease n=1 Tax=Fimbriiglobus ruber TaxID=1908690 RepID=A0A225DVY9_9BACT|nr:serine protease [Fimbriiglobus ruber]OWK45203.1 hypothetical protein FRUB_01534 [Fimbriiglobus ruber]